MTDQATINTMKGKPHHAGELHGVFLCMNDYNDNDNDKNNSNNTIKP
ncbi:hypothetical protein [Polaromonas sp. YR568]